MSNAAVILDKYLEAIFDTEDPLYRSLIADSSATLNENATNPMELGIGAIAGVLEWNRRLSQTLIDQLFIDLAETKYLDLIVNAHIGILRYVSETDTEYAARTAEFLVGSKISRASIIYYTRRFSAQEPEILSGFQDSAFADLSFSDVYTGFRNESTGDEYNWYVFPAIATNSSDGAYRFVLLLTDTPDADVKKVLDYLERWVTPGIGYELQIRSS